jgi:hypothetical protein
VKEFPNPNYSLKVMDLVTENINAPGLVRFIEGGWDLTLNNFVSITFLPYLPISPWPPPHPDDFDAASDRDGAYRVLFAKSAIVVTPTDGRERTEDVVSHIGEPETVFWVSNDRYARLETDLLRLARLPGARGVDGPRLDSYPDGELKRFIREDLGRATALSEYDRKILCLPPR